MTEHDKGWKVLFEIFWAFFKMGPVTFGGGYAMIPLIEKDLVHNRKWVQQQDIADVLAIAGTAPGAIAVNTATFIGYRIAGIKGAVAALVGIVLPTFLIVLLLAVSYVHFKNSSKVEAAFQGIRPAIVALITFAGLKIGKSAVLDKSTFVVTFVTIIVLLVSNIHPIVVILLGLITGVAVVKLKVKFGLNVTLEPPKQNKDNNSKNYYSSPDYFIGDGI